MTASGSPSTAPALSHEDSHPNVRAQRRAAAAILPFLAAAGVTPPPNRHPG